MKARLVEVFSSIQGEGLWVGEQHTFIRFHGCALHCDYCDTPKTHLKIKSARIETEAFSEKFEEHGLEFEGPELTQILSRYPSRTLALTGGEPLEQSAFLKEWLPQIHPQYRTLLETSGTLTKELELVLPWIDLVSLDLKLPSTTKEVPMWTLHREFLKVASQKPHYAKIVFDETMTSEEKSALKELIEEFAQTIFVFQPVSPLRQRDLKSCFTIFSEFTAKYGERVRFLPQVHKFLAVL